MGHERLSKLIIGEGVWGGEPQKPERFNARKGNENHICDPPPHGFINEILTPPPFGVEFFS